MTTRRGTSSAWVVTALVLLLSLAPVGYFVAYYATVGVGITAGVDAHKLPYYAIGKLPGAEPLGPVWPDIVFWPAYQIDRRVRPDVWRDDAQILLVREEFRKLIQRSPGTQLPVVSPSAASALRP